MKKTMMLVLGILVIGLAGIVVAEDITCSTDADCGSVTTADSCSNETSLCTTTITPTCYEAGTNESYCENVTEEVCEDCSSGETCETDACVAEAVCDSEHLSLCTGENECGDAGGEWEDNACNKEEQEPEENEIEDEIGCPELTQEECETDEKCIWDETKDKCRNKRAVLKSMIRGSLNITCPEDCICTGSTVKCETEDGRIMTVYAGRSGNIIIQTKTANASTTVELIKNASGLFGNFAGGIRKIKYTPDQIRERVLKRLKMRNCEDCNIILNEDGTYEMNVERTYRVFFIFPRKIVEVVKIDSETGEEAQIRRPWWRFLAFKNKE